MIRQYQAPGPVADAFLASDARVRAIMGPIGSAKTSTILMDIVYRAARQRPSPVDGVRYYKAAVVRDTYPNLQKTTLPSWLTWVSKDFGQFRGEVPIRHAIKFQLPDGTFVDLLVEFIALGDQSVEDAMRGWEGTHVVLDEADRLSEDVLTYVLGRVGRYPSSLHGGPSWYGVSMAFNAPDTDNYLYRRFVETPFPNEAFFRQPSGLDPRAENRANLPATYYQDQMSGQPDWYIRRMIRNEWGYSRDGKPVYPEFNDSRHVASEDLAPIPGLPLIIGSDTGLTPGLAILQRTAFGQWRCLDELVATGMGGARFGEALNQLLAERYKGFKAITAWSDPAGNHRADSDESSWMEVMSARTGFAWRPAPGNNSPLLRIEALRAPLTRSLDDGQPGFLLSPRCKVLRKAFNSGYRLRRVAVAGGIRYEDKPEKNEFSHVMEGLQYGILGGGEHHEVLGRRANRANSNRPVVAGGDWSVFR